MIKNTKYNNPKIYYIHGYQSSPDGHKGVLFKNKLQAKVIKYRNCEPEDLIITSCLQQIYHEIKDDKNVILIGSSLGGFLAASTAFKNNKVKKIILLNPAIIPPHFDLDKLKDIPRSISEDMINPTLFEDKIDAEVIILRGTEDEVIPDSWVVEFAKAQEATVMFLHDDHRFSRYLKQLPSIISKLLKN